MPFISWGLRCLYGQKSVDIFLISHQIRFDMELFYCEESRMNGNPCVAITKNSCSVGHPLLGCLRCPAITLALILFTNPSARAGYDTRSIFKRSLTGLNSEFSFSKISYLTKAEEPSLSYYLPIAGGRITGFIPSPRVLVLCEMQSVSSRIWTRVAVSISYDDNDYTTGTW